MYISHKHKIVVLRVPKAASSSLSEFLIKNLRDPKAIYTTVDDTRISSTVDKRVIKKYRKYMQYVHLTLEQLIEERLVNEEMLNTYRFIAVIRNPVERQISGYYFRKKHEKNKPPIPPSLSNYKDVTNDLVSFKDSPLTRVRQTDFLKVNGVIRGEYWLYEDLENHLNKLMNELGLEIINELPTHKVRPKTNRKDIEFDDEVMKALLNHFKEDFELYNKLKEESNVSIT